jgi:hypothetical protein
MSAKTKCGVQNVAISRLSPLARWILQQAEARDGIERGQIAEGFFGLSRFYRGFYVDPCLTRNQRRDRDRVYRRAQPLISKTLKRLEAAGLIELIRCNHYTKLIRLMARGVELANELNNTAPITDHGSCQEMRKQSTRRKRSRRFSHGENEMFVRSA